MSVVDAAVVALLVLINAFYVGSEFGAVSVRRSRIRERAEAGDRRAEGLLATVEHPRALDRYVAASQIGITASSLVLGAYGQALIAPDWAGFLTAAFEAESTAAFAVASTSVLLLLTILQVVLGELVPKSLALQYPTEAALRTSWGMQLSLRAFAWFIAVLNGSGLAILKWMRVADATHRHIHSPEEIELLLVESRDGGLLEPDEAKRLHRALRLQLRAVRQLMVPRTRIVALDAAVGPDDALQFLLAVSFTRVPVYRGSIDTVVGMLHTKDAASLILRGTTPMSIESLLRPLPSVPETADAHALLRFFREERAVMALVVDEYGGTAGLVTIQDVLDELFGPVGDEFKPGDLTPERLPDGRVRLPGSMRLEEAAEWTGAGWTGEADTLGGLIIQTLGRVPGPGERLTLQGRDVEVERVEGRALATVLVAASELRE